MWWDYKAAEPDRPDEVVPYERRLSADWGWALDEGGRFLDERSRVHEALRRITQRLDQLGIPYAVAGGMALFEHGYRRSTEAIDILPRKGAGGLGRQAAP